jgi:UMF1 family MFS transporter
MIPKEKSAEYFSFYDIFSKFSSIMGPFVFALVADYSGSSRYGILTLVLFFGGGIWVLSSVKTKEVYYATEKLH